MGRHSAALRVEGRNPGKKHELCLEDVQLRLDEMDGEGFFQGGNSWGKPSDTWDGTSSPPGVTVILWDMRDGLRQLDPDSVMMPGASRAGELLSTTLCCFLG